MITIKIKEVYNVSYKYFIRSIRSMFKYQFYDKNNVIKCFQVVFSLWQIVIIFIMSTTMFLVEFLGFYLIRIGLKYFSIFIVSTIFLLIGVLNCSDCSSPSSLSPCTCTNENWFGTNIICSELSDKIDLVEVFERLPCNHTRGQLQYRTFILIITSIEHLPNDVFRGVWFEKFFFRENPNLTCVHPNAFGPSQNFTKTSETRITSFAKM